MVVAMEDKGHVKKGVKRKLSEGETASPVPVIEGMSAAEVSMVRRLAGNDPLVRKKTVRKLRKWLTALAKKCPDTPETRKDVESNFVRVWKALFYCMWMADKPLPQEQLAEQISELVGIFDGKPNTMLLFVEWFFRTMAREWSWIDRYRLDKFMMLVRRVLRKTFSVMSNSKWKAETLDGFLKIVRTYVFNHQKLAPAKRNSESFNMKKPAIEPTITCPMGLQIHLTDIYLEELAKVDAEKLNSSKVLKLISPFVNELASNDDMRIIDEIKERVFHHLMKQSDVGMDYYEGLTEGPDSEDEFEDMDGLELEEGMEDDGDLHENGNDEDDDGLDNDEDLNQDELNDSALDPRAGKVDVVLPQLDIDYAALAEKLKDAGAGKLVKKKNRGLLYSLAHQFREIVQGKYPLALPEEEPNTPAIPKKEIKQATRRLVESEDNTPKIRLTKKQRRREARKAAAAAAGQDELNDTHGSEDASAFLNDTDLLDHVSDNYASYVHEQMEKESVPALDENLENEVNDENDEDMPPSPKVSKKQKKMEKEKKKYKTVIEFECDDIDSASKSATLAEPEADNVIIIKSKKSPSTKKVKKIRRISDNSLTSEESPTSKNVMKTKNKEELKSIKQNAQNLKSIQSQLFQGSSPATPINKNLKKIQESTPMKTPVGTPTLSSSAKKRVSFILARNSEHEATDYMSTISKSPAVPFDANKTPSSGPLLKTPVKKQPKRLSLKMSPRKTALDFF